MEVSNFYFLKMPDKNQLMLIAVVLLVLLIIYFVFKQDFAVYTSGASQRFASEFTSTNQEHFLDYMDIKRQAAGHLNQLIRPQYHKDNFTSENRYANDKHKIQHNSPKSEQLERELFQATHIPFNL